MLIRLGKRYKSDFKKIKNHRETVKTLNLVIYKLLKKEGLEAKYRLHELDGNYKNYSECHIKPDLLLIFKLTSEELYLLRLGSHSDLF